MNLFEVVKANINTQEAAQMYDTFIPKGCKVPWALRGGIAVIAMTAAELPGNRLHRFLLFSPDSRYFAKHRPSDGSEKSNVFAVCP